MTRPLIYIPIEPITERYTEQWYRCLPPQFKAAGFDVTVVDGTPLLNNEIKVGTFLDINSTTHYKWSQLMQISRLFQTGQIADGSVFFFGDIEFWGRAFVGRHERRQSQAHRFPPRSLLYI